MVMIAHATRIAILAVVVALAVVLGYERTLPATPITDGIYLLAGLIGVLVAGLVDWLWTRFIRRGAP
jgi:drug/metabolite transporter (DMT)-like permease